MPIRHKGKTKETKQFVIKREIKFKSYKNCLKKRKNVKITTKV